MATVLVISILLVVTTTHATQKYKFCAPDSISPATCAAIERGDNQVSCFPVADNAECAIRLANGDADFGVFSSEALLLAYQFYPNSIVPIFELRHKDYTNRSFEFQSVAVVSTDYKPSAPGRGFEDLRNGGLCHPGFSKAQWWNDYILKYFERKVYNYTCRPNLTAAENEAENIKSFFGQACRPGDWASESSFDVTLKQKYPELCALCDDKTSCRYNNKDKHGHIGALNCLTSGKGKVAYVALEYVREYFTTNQTHQFLCPDGTVQNLTTESPCTWISQPWKAIAARKEIAIDLLNDLKNWLLVPYASESWTISLSKVLQEDSVAYPLPESTSLASYLAKGRTEMELSRIRSCGNPIRWCTTSDLETAKCEWIAKEAIALGIEPKISCKSTNSTFACLRDIADNKNDIISIDSNYGYLARKVYNLSPVLYAETDKKIVEDSMIVAVVREPHDDDYPIKSFQQLEGRTACFPEYGGIAWLSFINIARINRIIPTNSCDYSKLLANLFSGACTPGIADANRFTGIVSTEAASKLCSTCPREKNGTFCSTYEANRYYGDKGAITCLNEGAGDIAFVEVENLKGNNIDQSRYRILCKNGSLAILPGINQDNLELCALSVTVNSEIIGRKNDAEDNRLNAILSLLKLEDWLGYRVYSSRVLHIYGKFNNTDDLLFKSSTIGLETVSSKVQSILAYKELFSHVDACSSAMSSLACNFYVTILIIMLTIFYRL